MRPGEDPEAYFARLLDELEHHENWLVRDRAASQLGHFGDSRAVEPLLTAIQDPHPEVRSAALGALGLVGDTRVVERLIAVLEIGNQQPTAYWTNGAAWALGKLRDRRAVESLIRRLRHPEAAMRMQAAYSLGEIGDDRATESLVQRLKDAIGHVRAAAASALGQIGDTDATEPLIGQLVDPDSGVRLQVVRALGRIRDPRAVSPLVQLMNDTNHNVICYIAEALGEIGDSRALQVLLQSFVYEGYSDRVKLWIGGPIGKVGHGDESAFEILMEALNGENPLLRIAAIRGLGYLGNTKAIPALEHARRHDKGIDDETGESVKSAARVAIKHIMEFHNRSIESDKSNLP